MRNPPAHALARLAAALVVAALAPPTVAAQDAGYADYEALTEALRSLTDGSSAATLRSIGTSLEGRDIWLVEIAEGGPVDERPGLLVVGNLSADHLVGSSHAVEVVRYLLSGADGAAEVRERQVVYVVPRLDPDGAERMLGSPVGPPAVNTRPVDDDNDGRVDEDGPRDLNGDGRITVMRAPDAAGAFMVHPDDPRLMKRADPSAGETGAFTIYHEGVDADGDGFIAEDPPGGVDLDRNFQHAYPYYEAGAGPHMVSERESRALMDFVIAHRNIGAILTFGHTDNLVTPPSASGELADASALELEAFAAESLDDVFETGVFASGGGGGFGGGFGFGGRRFRGAQPGRDNDPSSGRRPATTVNREDRPYFEAASEAYRELTGIEAVGLNREAEGAFFQYGYFQFGVPSFSTPGWGLPEAGDEADAPGAGDRGGAAAAGPRRGGRGSSGRGSDETGLDARLLAGLEATGVEAFVDWTGYAHPTLGEVEIGGFRHDAVHNPPEAHLADLGRAHGAFVVRLAGMLPRVRFVETEVTAHGGGVFTVVAEVENAGFFPTSLQHGVVCRCVQPTTVQIQVDPDAVLSGAAKSATVRQLAGSGSRERFTWVIRGRAGAQVEIRLRSQKGGSDTTTVTLR